MGLSDLNTFGRPMSGFRIKKLQIILMYMFQFESGEKTFT